MFNVFVFFKALVLFVAAALIGFGVYAIAVPGASMLTIIPLLALAVGLSLVAPFAYPHLRGVKKGDAVIIVFDAQIPFTSFKIRSGVAKTSGRKGDLIRVVLNEGNEIQARVTDYSGILTPARTRVSEKEIEVEVR